jgi:hypothetical protein
MHSLAAVLNPEFGRSWHEAVAVVQEAATLWQPGLSIPGPEDIFVDEDGVLSFGFGDESSENPVTALATLLQGLLKGIEAPSSLIDLAAENAKAQPAHASLSSFSKALAFFERPNRANDLRAIAGRLQGFRERTSPEVEFDRLREKVARADEPTKETTEEPEKAKKKPVATRQQQAIAASVVGIITLLTLGFRSGVRDGLGSVVARAESGVQSVVSAGLTTLGISKPPSNAPTAGTPAANAPVQPLELERSASKNNTETKKNNVDVSKNSVESDARGGIPVRTTGVAKTAVSSAKSSNVAGGGGRRSAPGPAVAPPVESVTPPTPLPAASPASDSTTTGGPTLLPPLPPAEAPKPSPAILAPDGIFSSAYPDVKAPALLRQQLPREPAPGDDTGFFDMVIDELGNVANIKLISPHRRYHDRMLVAAAKAWKFRPATLNGQPVKYRLRIPIILTGMPGRP